MKTSVPCKLIYHKGNAVITPFNITVKPDFLVAINFGGSGYLIILAPIILAFLLAELILF